MKTKLVLAALLAAVLVAAAAPARAGATPRNVAILVYEGVEILDFAGPAEVLDSAGGFASPGGGTAMTVYTVSKTTKPLKSQGFITIVPEYSIENAPHPDIIVVPGGNSGSITRDPEFFAWVKGAAGKAEVTLTVCTGAFVIAKAGYLDGKEITTWYGAIDHLRREYPNSKVQSGRRFVDNGRFVTTAGVSAGIDGSLHLVARLFGRAVADQTARYMEYHWTPEPYLAKGYALLNPSTDEAGRRRQMAEIRRTDGDLDGALRDLKEVVAANAADARAWYAVGEIQMAKHDRAGAAESFRKAAADAAIGGNALFNLACIAALESKPDDAIDYLRKAVASGFRRKSAIEEDADLASLRSDPRFRELVASL